MAELKFCVVCGEGSHREKWKNTSGEFVACDQHTTGEIAEAVKLAKAAPVANSEPAKVIPPIEKILGVG